MGDYLKNGKKIGTCGRAYYATKAQLEKHLSDPEAAYYLDPTNKCMFAFPFPQYDGKAIGEINNFHEGERAEYFLNIPKTMGATHKHLWFHKHPNGGEGVNFKSPCCYSKDAQTSVMHGKNEKHRLSGQIYYEGSLHVLIQCVYCESENILTKEEAFQIADSLPQTPYDQEVARRIKETY